MDEFNFESFMNGNSIENKPISYARKQEYTAVVENLIKQMNDALPSIKEEIIDLGNRSITKPCKAFDDKLKGLKEIYQAITNTRSNLYFWYIESAKRRAS